MITNDRSLSLAHQFAKLLFLLLNISWTTSFCLDAPHFHPPDTTRRNINAFIVTTKISFSHTSASKLNLTHDENRYGNIKNKNNNVYNLKEQGKKYEISEEQPSFDSLDIVLERARKRKSVLLPIQLQAITSKQVTRFGNIYITFGDCMLMAFALKLGSIGFSIGYIFGKVSTPIVRRNNSFPIIITEIWSGGLAIIFDIVWNNVF